MTQMTGQSAIRNPQSAIPQWALPLGGEVWERINELLYEGWQPAAVMRELKLPHNKKRSLEVHARRYRNRRILAPLARLNELLAGGAEGIGPDYLKLLRMVVDQALTDEKKGIRAAAILGKFFGKIIEVGAKHEAIEAEREKETRGAADPQEVVAQILAMYGLEAKEA